MTTSGSKEGEVPAGDTTTTELGKQFGQDSEVRKQVVISEQTQATQRKIDAFELRILAQPHEILCNSRNLNPMLCIKWIELHGDRAGYDDPAMVSDIGSIEGRSYLFIGHQLCNDNPFMSYGVFADLRSKELGQGEPIAPNLRAMFGLRVAIITILTNKGGSGKTLAIGCANKWLMLENSAFYVAR
ncbi:acetyl-coenzyme A carboxylase carboxyl transferase subunit alpha, chloroplastic-like [Solanum verrucosum]|uniref:acetyl-coenzyme A carboxylase carboxyl transferase subunit alpha, chloroplastic-like n=1 Tax=Solanum verrucosum TaxID=315347 RepID=UPI0020D1377D|nr:acetyl-coenzyme A carboxylase carboxyl transferase subunit alpha, chloroplastic-like [Solanum verrucosum]